MPVKVLRNGQEQELEITLAEYPSDQLAASSSSRGSFDEAETDVLSGITVDDLSDRVREQFQIPGDLEGAVVKNVDPGSPAFEAGLRPGDVIQEIERQTVRNAEEAVKLSKKMEGDSVLLRVWSRGGSRFLVIENEQLG